MSAHAPGPWTAVGFEQDPNWDGCTYHIMTINDGGGALLFECDCESLYDGEAEATMALVAAAPDLLAAGRDLQAALLAWMSVYGEPDGAAALAHEYLDAWDAAEKKAKGGTA